MDAAPTKHPTSTSQIFPHLLKMFTFSAGSAQCWFSLRSAVSVSHSASGSQIELCAPCHRGLVQSRLHQSERALGCLILITAIHHVRNSLPPHVCFDLFLSCAVTVKYEGPCGLADTRLWKTPAQATTVLGAVHTGLSSELHARSWETPRASPHQTFTYQKLFFTLLLLLSPPGSSVCSMQKGLHCYSRSPLPCS